MKLLFAILILTYASESLAQNKIITVIGSSTAAGVGPSSIDSSWVRRVSKHYKSQGLIDTIFNHAVGGYNPYHAMPSAYVPPPNRPSPDFQNNVTRAIAREPDIVIISFVSNHYDVYTIGEIKQTLFTLFDSVIKAKKVAFVTTTQPRTGFSDEGRWRLRMLKDSIIKWFGNYSINFWNPIADSTNNTIAAPYRSSDDIHINDAGHRILFEQVVAKNIFNLYVVPVNLESFNAFPDKNNVKLEWHINSEEDAEVLVQRSPDGLNFETIKNIKIEKSKRNYRWDDETPSGLRYYRLQINSTGVVQHSKVIRVQFKNEKQPVANLYPVPARNILNVELKSTVKAKAHFRIVDAKGKSISSFTRLVDNDPFTFSFNVNFLVPGSYYMKMEYPGFPPITSSFQKL